MEINTVSKNFLKNIINNNRFLKRKFSKYYLFDLIYPIMFEVNGSYLGTNW